MTGLRPGRSSLPFARAALALALGVALSGPARTQSGPDLIALPYDVLAAQGAARADFETLPHRDEPGLRFDHPLRLGALWLGERFAGQGLADDAGFDHVTGLPDAPLALRGGAAGANLSVAFHRGFGSNALFPLGARGFPARNARGEGAVAVLFDEDQSAAGLRVHSDYADPLGGRATSRGHVTLTFYRRDGSVIATRTEALVTGITEIALRRPGGLPDIAGVVIVNDDPGGIAIDDILYQIAPYLG